MKLSVIFKVNYDVIGHNIIGKSLKGCTSIECFVCAKIWRFLMFLIQRSQEKEISERIRLTGRYLADVSRKAS